MKNLLEICLIAVYLTACAPESTLPPPTSDQFQDLPVVAAGTLALTAVISTETPSPLPATTTMTFTPQAPAAAFTPTPRPEIQTSTPNPVAESLYARVTAEQFLSCRYGPGPEYLYLYALNRGANIELIGRTDGNNWVLVKGENPCWVNTKFLEISGDPMTLRVMYPEGYKIPISPYYSPPAVLSATRDPDNPSRVTVTWSDITLRAGDEEDESMFIYIIEVWRCEGGQTIFDPLASNHPEITFVDEPGCRSPSHGRVYFQEKHGFAGPADIPWPGY